MMNDEPAPPAETATASADALPLDPAAAQALARRLEADAKRVLSKIPLLGPVAWLMMQQGLTRHTLLSELEWRVLPPLVLEQSKLFMRGEAPVAFVSWALLSTEAATRYRQAPHQLTQRDWQSGDEIWLIDLFTPFGGTQQALDDLRTQVFPGRAVHQLAPADRGEAGVVVWPALRASGTS